MGTNHKPPRPPADRSRIDVTRLRVPLEIALGHYEQLEDEQLDEHIIDIFAEYARRNREIPSLA